MSVRVADPLTAPEVPERDLLGRLGLRPGASNDQIESAHDEILEFLGGAPGSLRDWVRNRVFEVDEAYGLLNGATLAPSQKPAKADRTAEPIPVAQRSRGHSPTAAQVRVRAGQPTDGYGDALGGDLLDTDDGEWIGERGGATVISRRDRRESKAVRRVETTSSAPSRAVTIDVGTVRKGGIALGGLAAAAIAVFAIFQLGNPTVPGINGSPAPGASAGTLDTAAVAADMAKLQANANDKDALQDLANLYYSASDYETAKSWLDKVLALDPKNVAALLGYGAAAYNLGDNPTAEAKWRAVLAVDPKNVEAHYDLGFMYFSSTPPNIDGVKTEWNAVLALNPGDDLKAYIQAHLASLDNLSSGAPASGTPSGSRAPASTGGASSPAPAASPAGSPAASPAPAAS